jgi:undecaprenyl diphosphate synthase
MDSIMPEHVGIIMDGNGRWAKQRSLVRTQGHLEGLKTAKKIVKAASDLGVKYLTLFAFSTENWKRASDEVGFIMGLVKKYLRAEFEFSKKNKIRVRHAGDISGLPEDIQKELLDSIAGTSNFTGMQVILAINYGGRDEIVREIKKIANNQNTDINEKTISEYLDNPDVPEPDLIIRTAGEYRTSNFLLWQGAYSEIYISDKLWPDWEKKDLEEAIESFKKRERRYGGVKS